ncbi:ATP-binding protein [Thermoanaerobacter ethanolicus]|uniref:ATP-binding protein n=1 Tax=Thermoanaerobacter ethanolicus TaxID=1757 RepID=UPI00384F8B45
MKYSLFSLKGFVKWGELMWNPILATPVLDRLLHHAHIINIRRNSYRLKDKLKTTLYGTLNIKA